MTRFSPTPKHDATRDHVAGFTHLRHGLDVFFAELFRDAEDHVERNGGFRGPIRPRQRPWSRTLDILVAEQEGGLA